LTGGVCWQDKEAVARAERRAAEAIAQLQREQQASKQQMDSLTERVDALKDELSTTERLLATADDKLHTFASHSEQLQAVQVR
jgi:septal ring factor EnvC (AmiA/AmiB activator)